MELPVVLSTGLIVVEEISGALDTLSLGSEKVTLLQFTTWHPARLHGVGIDVSLQFRELFVCPVGLFDHSGVLAPLVSAVSAGASMVELPHQVSNLVNDQKTCRDCSVDCLRSPKPRFVADQDSNRSNLETWFLGILRIRKPAPGVGSVPHFVRRNRRRCEALKSLSCPTISLAFAGLVSNTNCLRISVPPPREPASRIEFSKSGKKRFGWL